MATESDWCRIRHGPKADKGTENAARDTMVWKQPAPNRRQLKLALCSLQSATKLSTSGPVRTGRRIPHQMQCSERNAPNRDYTDIFLGNIDISIVKSIRSIIHNQAFLYSSLHLTSFHQGIQWYHQKF